MAYHLNITRSALACLCLSAAFSISANGQEPVPVAESPDAYLDWANEQLCLPVEILDQPDSFYDACLQLISNEAEPAFELISLQPRAHGVPGMAQYSASHGLLIPVIKTSQGQTFVNAHLALSESPDVLELIEVEEALLNDQHSIARQWNEQLLEAIRDDLPRPTVHARNLFHTAVALYDAWAAFDETASPYLLGKTVNGFTCPYSSFPVATTDSSADRNEAISYAAYRLLAYRFEHSPGAETSLRNFRNLMVAHHYDPDFINTDYTSGNAAALGNHIAECIIDYGAQDGAREADNYSNLAYLAANPPLAPMWPGSQGLSDPDHWQPLAYQVTSDDSGILHYEAIPAFLSADWGQVAPFALGEEDLSIQTKDGEDYFVYHDPGAPPLLDPSHSGGLNPEYVWNFATVALWSSQLDPTDGVYWDISPGSLGNLQDYPETFGEYEQFFDQLGGGDPSTGHEINPATGQPYTPQRVPRGDYTRALAEFWADGPDSETPPGHWFVILNHVNDHPLLERRLEGDGEPLDRLEWDIKSYLALGGAMHDAAIAAWSIKAWYDYIRPISAIRYLTEMGQSSDSALPNYDPDGIPLVPGYLEVVLPGDPLAGENDEHVGKLKLFAWRGSDSAANAETGVAGVGWILAENWSPYQPSSAVTPAFAGYISGHSTFSSAAAEVLELFTGDPYFPGGMGEFVIPANGYLKFESGPSMEVRLQWATYRDASDQTSLSRIWGGIHPPVDDIPGRHIGKIVGADAFAKASDLFTGGDL